ncbi:heterokaryon incompatibility protein-domain-containing protein [Cubamyces lactineus]|nr:heterokaryon incompatibility protein-domain-containing protein [Cubamyces lactineus]
MWLLSTDRAELYPFPDPFHVPDGGFAILSHVWGTDEQTFQDVQALTERCRTTGQNPRDLVGAKIREFCVLSAQHGYKWAWIDTCCIDKTSSAELSEAINSMFGFYSAADVCFVYLHDVPGDCTGALGAPDSAFRRSRWHTRGWTLQEMVAPCFVLFFSAEWTRLGDRRELASLLTEISGVDKQFLVARNDLRTIPVGRRMRWAAHRQTTRFEDQAYCLLGIFHITMPILYGEGWRAFLRLQEEIVKRYNDLSIFAWGPCLDSSALRALEVASLESMRDLVSTSAAGVFASSPSRFSEHPVPGCSSSTTSPQKPRARSKLARALSSYLNVRSDSGFLPTDVQGPGFPTFRTTPYGGLMHALVLEVSGMTIAFLEYRADGSSLGLLLHPCGGERGHGYTDCFALTCGFVEKTPGQANTPDRGSAALAVFRLAVVDDAFCSHSLNGKRPRAKWRDVHLIVEEFPVNVLYYLPPVFRPSRGGDESTGGNGPPFWLSSTVFDRLYTTWGFVPVTSACCLDPASDHATYVFARALDGVDAFVLSIGRCSNKKNEDDQSCGWAVAFPLPDRTTDAPTSRSAASILENPTHEATQCGEHRCPEHHIPRAARAASGASTHTFGDPERTIILTCTRSRLFPHPAWKLDIALAGSVYDGYARNIARTVKSTAPWAPLAGIWKGGRSPPRDSSESALTLSWVEMHHTALARWRSAIRVPGEAGSLEVPTTSVSLGSSTRTVVAVPAECTPPPSHIGDGREVESSCLVPSPYHSRSGS